MRGLAEQALDKLSRAPGARAVRGRRCGRRPHRSCSPAAAFERAWTTWSPMLRLVREHRPAPGGAGRQRTGVLRQRGRAFAACRWCRASFANLPRGSRSALVPRLAAGHRPAVAAPAAAAAAHGGAGDLDGRWRC